MFALASRTQYRLLIFDDPVFIFTQSVHTIQDGHLQGELNYVVIAFASIFQVANHASVVVHA